MAAAASQATYARSQAQALAQAELEDNYLIALAKQGRPDAYDRILKRYHGFVRLKASSYFLIGGDSDDLIQEGMGLRPRVAGACDQIVRLPQRGRVDSLNVATAASALMYGILHFRGEKLDRGT